MRLDPFPRPYPRPYTLTLMLWVVAGVAWQLAPVASAQQPNIVLIISDDQNWRDLSFMGTSSILNNSGNPVVVNTPNIDQLASSGVMFNRDWQSSRFHDWGITISRGPPQWLTKRGYQWSNMRNVWRSLM